MPTILKREMRMEDRLARGGDDQHSTFKKHEDELIVRERGVETAPELGDAEDAADVDREGREHEAWLGYVSEYSV